MIWLLCWYALFGIFFTSFALCYVMRDKKISAQSVRFGRSLCDHCGATLRWYELIPIVSWLIQKGRCNHCQKKLPVSYLVSECAAWCIFALVWYLLFPLSWLESAIWLLMLICAYSISLYDIYHKELDLKLYMLWRIALVLYYLLWYYAYVPEADYYSGSISMLIWFGWWLLIWMLGVGVQKMKSGARGEWFGFGDVLVGWLLGALVPLVYSAMVSRELLWVQDVSWTLFALAFLVLELFISSVLGILGHLSGFHTTKHAAYSDYLPFLPYMIWGFVISAIVIYMFGHFFMI